MAKKPTAEEVFSARADVAQSVRSLMSEALDAIQAAESDGLYPDGLPANLNAVKGVMAHYVATTPAPVEPEEPNNEE